MSPGINRNNNEGGLQSETDINEESESSQSDVTELDLPSVSQITPKPDRKKKSEVIIPKSIQKPPEPSASE